MIMEHKNIIIILIAIIIVLAAMIGITVLHPFDSKDPTKVKITSNKTQYEGGELSIKLTDLNGTAISKEIVNVTITNSKGKAKLDLDLKKGKYNVNVSYDGNENYTGNNTTQKLTIEEKVVVAQASSSSSSSYSSSSGDTYVESTDGVLTYGYKDGRYGFWTPSGIFHEDKSRAMAGIDPVEPFLEDGSWGDQL